MTHRLSFFRPAWSDEEQRARELAGEDLTKLIRMATGKGCQFYVLGKSHPVERLTGVIAWGEKQNDPGTACFGFWIPRETRETIVAFLDSFRAFIFEKYGACFQRLHNATLLSPEHPAWGLLEETGFAPGLANEVCVFSLAKGVARLDRMRQSPRHRFDLRAGCRIETPRPSHLPELQRLCSQLHQFMSPAALDDAFKSAGHSTASFVPAISGVYLEEETVRGAILIHCRNNQLGISALVADPSAQMPSNRICLWLINHSIGPSQALGLADEWIISTDPETQPATLRMITRLGGRKLKILYRMEASSNAVEKAA